MSTVATEPRELTGEEIREKLIAHIYGLIYYWNQLPGKAPKERLEGLAFSILSALDGESLDFPAFIVAPDPDPEDRQYHVNSGENWFPENDGEALKGRVKWLHEHFYEHPHRT